MTALKPAYLIHGDDHGAIAERRARLKALAEAELGSSGSVEALAGDSATPAGVAQALASMTLTGPLQAAEEGSLTRVILVEGVERWKGADVKERLAPALKDMMPGTTVALFAREDSRVKAPDAVHEAVERAGGQSVAQMVVKPWHLPGWVSEQATKLGLSLDSAASKALIAQVGERQQRLLRELEKMALERDDAHGSSETISSEDVEARAAHSAEWRAYTLADTLVAGDVEQATAVYLGLREQGEQMPGLVRLIAQRLRDALSVALRLAAGERPAEVRKSLRMPSKAAERFIADVGRTSPERLREALIALADLELDSRGGAVVSTRRTALAALSEDTLALRAIAAMGGAQQGS